METIKLADGSSINLGTSAPLGVSDRSRADYWRGDALQADWAASTTDALLDNQASALVNAMATFRAGAEGISANLAWRRPEPVSWMAVDGR